MSTLCLLVLAIPAFAEQPPAGTTTEPRLARKNRVRSNVAMNETVNYRLVIPVVGNAAGANGTHFKSAVTILNQNQTSTGAVIPQNIKVEFYPLNGTAGPPTYYVLTYYAEQWDNFLAEFFNPPITGLGAIVITAVTSARVDSPTSYIDAVSRIYTKQPSSANCLSPNGEVSQALSSADFEDINATPDQDGFSEYGLIMGARQDANFRTNLGIINHSSSSQKFEIEVGPFNGKPNFFYEVTVPARGMIHQPVPTGDYGIGMLLWVAPVNPGPFFFSAYAATTDNRTGDGWTFRASF